VRGFYSAEAHPLYQLGGTPLSDIFISYAKADRNEALKLSAYLESLGYGVWWDRGLQSGDEFRDVIIAAGALRYRKARSRAIEAPGCRERGSSRRIAIRRCVSGSLLNHRVKRLSLSATTKRPLRSLPRFRHADSFRRLPEGVTHVLLSVP
jgi:hypothetical protein